MAANVKVVLGLSRTPYIDAEARKSVVLELANLVFTDMKITPEYRFASNKRMEDLLLKKQVDIAIEVTPFSSALFYSDTFITYKNFVVLRKKLIRDIRSYQDLQGLSVCGWQNASRDLGASFVDAEHSFASY